MRGHFALHDGTWSDKTRQNQIPFLAAFVAFVCSFCVLNFACHTLVPTHCPTYAQYYAYAACMATIVSETASLRVERQSASCAVGNQVLAGVSSRGAGQERSQTKTRGDRSCQISGKVLAWDYFADYHGLGGLCVGVNMQHSTS